MACFPRELKTRPEHEIVLYRLAGTYETQITLAHDELWFRIELFQDHEVATSFRVRIWDLEHFRLTPSFPQDEEGSPIHSTDDILCAERTAQMLGSAPGVIQANSVDEALAVVLNAIKTRIAPAP